MINLKSAQDISNKLPDLVVEAEQIAHSFMRGDHNRKKTGSGDDFWQFRKWQHGDNVSNIDWRQTAKSDDVYIKEKEWHSAQSVWVYSSNSKTMDFTSNRKYRSKKDYADILLLALSVLMLNGGEKVSVLGSDLPLQLGDKSIANLYAAMQRTENMQVNLQTKNKSQVIVISDFFDSVESLKVFCASLAAKNIKALFVQINDKAEEALPYKGKIKFTDIASDAEKLISKVENVAETYNARFLEHRVSVEDVVSSNGFEFKHYTTDMDIDDVMQDLYKVLMAR